MFKKIIKQLKKKINRVINKIKFMKKRNDKILYLSFGENCLTDDILSRNKLKSFSTPYSSGRSNIEYILQIENDNFKNFLNINVMKYDYVGKDRVVRLTTYDEIANKYAVLQMNGFEFTHHDVLDDANLRETMKRRYERLLNLNNKKVCIFYHHRYCENNDLDMLVSDLVKLKTIYENRNNEVEVFLFKQEIVKTKKERHVEKNIINGVRVYEFFTTKVWEGHDQDVFWARCDDDLIKVMIDDTKKCF